MQKVKPINKPSLTVEFEAGDLRQKMELPRPPSVGEFFYDVNLSRYRVTEVIYIPWNENMPDLRVRGIKDPQTD